VTQGRLAAGNFLPAADITGAVRVGTNVRTDTDEALMLAFRSGERDAFAELFGRYRDPIWRFFRRRVVDDTRAEELAQDTFLAVLQAARRYQPSAAFRSYLFGIAFNVLMAWRRKTRRLGEQEMADLDPPDRTADPDQVLWVRDALAGLDPMDREVLMLREYEQLSYDEIANAIGVPLGTVRSRLFRARMALREKLIAVAQPLGVER
jgi:RNA polymerase sigma-70 factor (ECF subfamily)